MTWVMPFRSSYRPLDRHHSNESHEEVEASAWTIQQITAGQPPPIDNLGELFMTNSWWARAVVVSTEVYKEGVHTFLLLELELDFELDFERHQAWLRIQRRAATKSSFISRVFSLGTAAADDQVNRVNSDHDYACTDASAPNPP